jgi:hypothetical protein
MDVESCNFMAAMHVDLWNSATAACTQSIAKPLTPLCCDGRGVCQHLLLLYNHLLELACCVDCFTTKFSA